MIRQRMEQMTKHIAMAHGCEAAFTWTRGSAAVINDAGLCATVQKVAQEMGFQTDRQEDCMGAEDFSEYLKRKPGVFIRVGTGGFVASHHPRFTVDPEALYPAAIFFAQLAEERARA